MAFVVEDGTGLINSNAYTSVAFMRAYFADVGTTFAQADGLLQVAIIKATRYVENRFGGRWLGQREFPEVPQALGWPRLYVMQPDSCEYYTGVPEPLQRAVSEYAARALTTELQPVPTASPFVTRTKKKAAAVEIEEQRLPGLQLFTAIPAADLQLRGLIFSGSYTYR